MFILNPLFIRTYLAENFQWVLILQKWSLRWKYKKSTLVYISVTKIQRMN